VTGGDTFQEVIIRRDAESVALTSPNNATGVFELDAQTELFMPFESMGVATSWSLSMPRAANAFDFDTIADVLLTLEYTAFSDSEYRQQVIQRLPRQAAAVRTFSVCKDFPDVWYGLSNPVAGTPTRITYRTERWHFPTNLQSLVYQDLMLALVLEPSAPSVEGKVILLFAPDGVSEVSTSSEAILVEGRISTATSAPSWRPLVSGRPVTGSWSFEISREINEAIAAGQVNDIFVAHTFTGVRPTWPLD